MTDKTQGPCGSDSNDPLGPPIAYLYHDTGAPKDAHPWLHSTMLVLAADRREGLRGETPLVTLEAARARVAHEARQLAAQTLEHIANEPPVSGNELAQARVLLAASQLRRLDVGGENHS